MENELNLSDYELITRVLDGDKDYFAELVRRYKNLVYSVVMRMLHNRDEADDLAQEIFIKAYINLDKYYPDYKFSTWIIRISTNHVIDYRRKNHNETQTIEDIDYSGIHGLAAETSPETEYLKKELKQTLDKLVGSLPEMYRIPIILYHEQGLSYQEIADIIEQPLSKVKNRIFRGRKMLKESLTSNAYIEPTKKNQKSVKTMKEEPSYGLY